MAKMGRPPKRGNLKVVKGGFGNKKSKSGSGKKGQPSLPPAAPDLPDHLDALEIKIWDTLVKQLSHIGVLQKFDEGTLSSYCGVYARMIRSKEALNEHRKKHGSDFFATDGRHGEMFRVHPAVGVIERCEKTIKALAIEFGMTPAGRKGLGYDSRQLLLPGLENAEDNKTDPTAGLLD